MIIRSMIILMLLTGCTPDAKPGRYRVMTVGGCNIDGLCGVIVEQGLVRYKGRTYFPVEGEFMTNVHGLREIK